MARRFSPITLGEQLKSLEIDGFVLTETRHPPRFTLARHTHERANIMFVLSGSFTEMIGSHPQECLPLSLLLKPAGEAHSDRYGNLGARCLIIEVKPQRLEAIRPFSELFNQAEHVRGGRLPAFALRVYQEFRTRDKASSLVIEGLVLEMLGHLTRRRVTTSPSAPPRWLRRATDFCREHFSDRLSLTAIAAAAGVHPSHLARTFRRHHQCTIGDYVRRLRLDYAARELAESDKTFADIAAAAGFYDHSHFTHSFNLQMGMTPTEYRATLKGRK